MYAIQFIPTLKYIDYELINNAQREAAKIKYADEPTEKEGGGAGPADDSLNIDKDLIEAKIDITYKMIDRIQDESEDALKLKILNKYQDCWSPLEQFVDEHVQKF